MSRTQIFTAALSLLLLGAGAAGFWLLSQGAPGSAQSGTRERQPPLVETVVARVATTAPTISQTGFLQPFREVDVAFEIQGRISMVADTFAVGNQVAADAVLARIDTERYAAAVEQAEADLAAAEARQREAEQAFQRQAELEDRGVTAQAALDEVRTARESAEAQVAVAEAGVEVARIDLRSAEIRSPFEAFVTRRTASEGQFVTPGQPVGQLVRADIAQLIVGLADRQVEAVGDVGRLIDTEVEIRRAGSDAEDPLRIGRIVDVEARLDAATRTTSLVVDVPDPFGDAPLRLGELLVVTIPLQTPDDLVAVPVDAVKDGRRVWTIAGDGTLAAREVDVILRSEELAWLSGAADLADTRLMTTDLAGATDGTEVRVAETGSARDTSEASGTEEEFAAGESR